MDNNRFRRSWDYWLLWAVLVFSLILNVYVFIFVGGLRHALKGPVSDLGQIVKDIQTQAISTKVNIREDVPFSTQVSVKDTFKIPIKTSVQVRTTVNVPVIIPIIEQEVTLRVPINTTVPVDTVITVPFNSVIPVKGTSPISLEVPISLEIKQTPFGPFFEKLYNWILEVEQKL